MRLTTLTTLYGALTDKQKQELKRTGAGVTSQVLREGIELYRMFDKPTQEEVLSTENFLENLYSNVVGAENVERVQRGDREVVTIAEPESGAAQLVRDIGSFGASLAGVGKITKPLQALKPIQKATQVAPKTVATTGFVAKGETAAQLSLNPYQENFANILGDMIDDDSEGFASDLEKYMLEPIKSSQEKTELQNRLGLLAEGLIFTGAFGAVGAGIRNREAISKSFFNTLDSIKGQGKEVSEAFMNNLKRVRAQDREFFEEAVKKRQQAIITDNQPELFSMEKVDLGDIDALKLTKFSTIGTLRSISNVLAKTFTTRGGRSELLHENYLKTQNKKEKWNATIDHTARNLENSINNIYKEIGGNKQNILDDLNEVLFTKFKVKPTETQQQAFEKALLKFPEPTRESIRKARNLQDQLSKLLLKSENVAPADKKIIEDQLGFYVRESYKMFEDGGYIPTIQATNTARRFIAQRIKESNPEITPRRLRLETQAEMDKLAGGKGDFVNFSSGFETFGKVREGILIEKQNVPSAIKSYLGEITSPVDKLLISMKKIAQFVEDSNFHNQAYKDGKDIYFHESDNLPGFTAQIPRYDDVKVQPFGELSGMYTTPELAEYYTKKYQQGLSKLIPEGGFIGNSWRYLLFLKSQAQKSATTRRISTHIKNIFGGAQITGANGFKLLNPKTTAESFKTVYNQLTRTTNIEQQQFIEELAGQGVLNKNAIINDLKNMSKDASNVTFLKAKPLQYLESRAKKAPIIKQLLKADEKVTEAYIAEDDFWKINMYLNEKKHLDTFNKALPQGPNATRFDEFRYDTPQKLQNEAGKITREGLPNYDLVPDNLKEIRSVPFIGTFFSFLSESTRLAMTIPRQGIKEIKLSRELKNMGANEASDIMRNRAIDRFVGYSTFGLGGGAAATAVANYSVGVGQDVIDNIKPFLPEWMQNDNVVYTLNEEGVPIVYNVTPWDAFDFPRKPFQTILHKTLNNEDLTEEELQQYNYDLVNEIFTPFFGQSLTQEIFNAAIFNNGRNSNGSLLKNPLNKLEVYNPEAELGAFDKQNAKIIAMNLVEILEPGTVTDTRKYFRDKFGKEMTSLDQKIYREEAMFKWLTGFGGIPFNKEYVENIYSFKINDFKKSKRKANSQIYKAMTDEMTKEKFLDNYLNANREYYKSYKKLHTLTEAAENLELNTLKILKDNGVSKRDRVSFIGGNRYFTPVLLTDQMKQQMLDSPSLNQNYFDILLDVNRLSKTLNQLPVLVDPENKKEITIPLSDEVDKIFENLRIPKSTGGLITGPEVTDTKEDPADRVNPLTGSPYSDQRARLGLQEGGETSEFLTNVILQSIQNERKYNEEQINELKKHSNLVGFMESDNIFDRVQIGGGPGRGKYQYEIKGSIDGSGASKTAANRYIKYKTDRGLKLTETDLILQKDNNPDFSKYSEDLQNAVFYADKAMGLLPVDDLVNKKLSHEEAWVDYHLIGNKEKREENLQKFKDKNYKEE